MSGVGSVLSVKPDCAVEGCTNPQRKRTWCASHYAQWNRNGKVGEPQPFKYMWAVGDGKCLACGKSISPEQQSREFCSGTCRYRHVNGLLSLTTAQCIDCGGDIDLSDDGTGRSRREKKNVLRCRKCRLHTDYHFTMTVAELVERDGNLCGMCGKVVDLTLKDSRKSDDYREHDTWMSACRDHKIPRALGGTSEPENLQLAHMICNARKQDRLLIEMTFDNV